MFIMTRLLLVAAGLWLLTAQAARAESCQVAIESNDLMRYNAHEITVPASCSEVEVTLKDPGNLSAQVMGHDWVLARDADMSAIVNAGQAAGRVHGYLPQHDPRVIAATAIVGGGESATVTFSTATLTAGERYAFFCTAPGHAATMHGRFVFGAGTRVALAR
jgi:azurin